jgi:hypothetical protein
MPEKKTQKALIITAAFLLLLPMLHSLSITADKGRYFKGDSVLIHGDCVVNDLLDVSAEAEEGTVFSVRTQCSLTGGFEIKRDADFLDPSGEWFLKVKSPKSEAKARIIISPKMESSFYLISFISPQPGSHHRTSAIELTVRVTDAGRPVADANVVTWLFEGTRQPLASRGNGVYSLESEIPFDAPLGKKMLTVVAKSRSGENIYGGENSISLQVEETTVDLELLSPAARNFDVTDDVVFEVMPYYASGRPADTFSGLAVSLLYGDAVLDFRKTEKGTYLLSYRPSQSDIGNRAFAITAEDSAGNTGRKAVNLTFGCSAVCVIKSYAVYVLVALVVLLSIFAVFYSKIRFYFELKRTRSGSAKAERLIKELQKEYFGRGVMSASSYRKALASYKGRLTELRQKEKQLLREKENR